LADGLASSDRASQRDRVGHRRRHGDDPVSARLTTAEAAAAWFYPDRQRCLGCRRYFAGLVINRLYCTYECAGMEPPPLDPRLRPRSCRTAPGEAKEV